MAGPKVSGDDETVAAPPHETGPRPSAGSAREPSSATPGPSGSQIIAGRYVILGLVGVGGMGSVYRAHDRVLDEVVALKMLRPDMVDAPGALARFHQEVKLARRVTHPNVARMFDIGEADDGRKYLTMELVEGESLGALLAREVRLGVACTVEIASAICEGLAAAHQAGVVHRDLKPDNVLLDRTGRVVLTDFGIARASELRPDAPRVTQGGVVGTPAYMAPEQVQGAAVDTRADLYALGVMLYECLTGACPWGGPTVFAVAAARLSAPPPNPREHRGDVPDALARFVMRCMARAAEDRYASAAEAAAALASFTLPAQSGPGVPVSVRASTRPPAPPDAGTAQGDKTVAVLPFKNLGAPDDAYLADGLTEDLLDALSMTRGLRVRARGAVAELVSASRDARDVGKELGVQVVVEGTLRRLGDVIRVGARLVSVADGFQLWAKRFERPAAEILRVGDEAAAAIAEALTVTPAHEPPPRAGAADPVALDLYLRGRHEFRKFWQHSIRTAVDLLGQAHARAPDDPAILGAYAQAVIRAFSIDPESSPDYAERGRELAQRALALSPKLAEARVALANLELNLGRPGAAAKALVPVLAESVSSPDAHELAGRLLLELGCIDEAIGRLRVALALDPTLQHVPWELARAHAYQGDWAAATELLGQRPATRDGKNLYWYHRARFLMWRGATEEAKALMPEVARDDFPLKEVAMGLLVVAYVKMLTPEARAQMDALLQVTAGGMRRRAFMAQIKAELYAYVGDHETALASVAVAVDCALIDVLWMDRCPLLAPLAGDRRFAALRATVAARASEALAALSGG